MILIKDRHILAVALRISDGLMGNMILIKDRHANAMAKPPITMWEI